jgi:isoleucyl-tRNA synthetase
VRPPISKAIVPALSDEFAINLKKVEDVIKSEVNIKEIEIIDKSSTIIKKSAKPNFKALGVKVGKDMKAVTGPIFGFTNDQIGLLEKGETISIEANGNTYQIGSEDIEVKTAEIPGWQIMSDNNYTVALDLEISEELKIEGVARELVNKIQNLRKDKDFEVTDKIKVQINNHPYTDKAINAFNQYICGEILAESLELTGEIIGNDEIDIDTNLIKINLSK